MHENNNHEIDKALTYKVAGIMSIIISCFMFMPAISLYLGEIPGIIGRFISIFIILLGISFFTAGILCINQGVKYKKVIDNEQTPEDEATLEDFEFKIINLSKIATSVVMLTFVVFWFGVIGFLTYITIAEGEFISAFATIPFWIMGFYAVSTMPSSIKEIENNGRKQ